RLSIDAVETTDYERHVIESGRGGLVRTVSVLDHLLAEPPQRICQRGNEVRVSPSVASGSRVRRTLDRPSKLGHNMPTDARATPGPRDGRSGCGIRTRANSERDHLEAKRGVEVRLVFGEPGSPSV